MKVDRVDLHAHLAPDLDAAALGLGGPDALYRPQALVAHLDAAGLDEAIVSPPPPFFRSGLQAADATAWARALNEGVLRATGESPRLVPLAYLPLEHPERALAEYERVRGDARWAGLCASAGGRSVSLADPALESLWKALDEDARLLLLHPGESPDRRMHELYLHNLLGNPVETSLAAAQLVLGGVLSTYVRMRVLLVHCGGCVPSVIGRWERGVATARPGLPPLPESPAHAVRRFWVDCLAHDPGALDLAVDVFGEDKLVLGTDWPFPMGADDPRELVAHRGQAFADAVATSNAAACLGR